MWGLYPRVWLFTVMYKKKKKKKKDFCSRERVVFVFGFVLFAIFVFCFFLHFFYLTRCVGDGAASRLAR